MQLPESFRQNVIGAFPGGKEWLDALPSLLRECEKRWQITIGPAFDLSYNYVTSAKTAEGRKVVLKLGVPNPELTREIRTLERYEGRGAVRLIEADAERGFLLMERAIPGEPLTRVTDPVQATRIAARLICKLPRSPEPDDSFPNVATWAKGLNRLRQRFNGSTGPFPLRLVEIAEKFFAELLSSCETSVLLHGDLHHLNILSAGDGWIAIDPKGVVGEPAFEVGAFLENPGPECSLNSGIQRRRVDVLCEETGFDRERVLRYAVAHAVLSAWWSFEDTGGGWESGCACAEALLNLMS